MAQGVKVNVTLEWVITENDFEDETRFNAVMGFLQDKKSQETFIKGFLLDGMKTYESKYNQNKYPHMSFEVKPTTM
jgi:hypothetical protein